MRLESLRIVRCFGFSDSSDIHVGDPGDLVYFLGRNSSGKTSVLRALSSLRFKAVPGEHPNFENYEPPENSPFLQARFSIETDERGMSLSIDPIINFVISHFDSLPFTLEKEEDGYVTESSGAAAQQVATLLNTIERVYTELIEEVSEAGVVWVDKLRDGSYRFLGSGKDHGQLKERREAIQEALGVLEDGASFRVNSGSTQRSRPLNFGQIESRLFRQFPDIFHFTDRFSLDEDLPRSIREEHLRDTQNSLTGAFMDLLDQGTLRQFLQATRRKRIEALEVELQGKLDDLSDRINQDTAQAESDELVRIFVDRQDDIRVVLEVGGKETYYEHLSDNTKLLVAYHIFQTQRERENAQGSILLFDEPNKGFHPSAEGKMLRFLETLAEQGNQVVITTHSQYMIDLDRLSAVRLMGRDEENLLHVSNDIYRPASPGGDILALRPITEAIGLHYAEQLIVQDKVIVTEGYTDMLYLRVFKRILGHTAELNVAPLRGDSQIAQFVPFLISQNMAFKIILDSEVMKQKIRDDFHIPDENFYTIPLPTGSDKGVGTGIEDLFTKEDFKHLLDRYGLEVNEKKLANLPNSKYAGQEHVKTALATKLYSDSEVSRADFEQETLEPFERLLDFCASDTWFKPYE